MFIGSDSPRFGEEEDEAVQAESLEGEGLALHLTVPPKRTSLFCFGEQRPEWSSPSSGLLLVCAFLVSCPHSHLVFCCVFLLCLPGNTDGASAPSATPAPAPGPRAADHAPTGVPFWWRRESWRPGS